MDQTQVRRLLANQCTHQSRWEFTNFIMEPYGEFQGRAALAVLSRRRDIADTLAITPERMHSQRVDLTNELAHLDQWLDQYTEEELAAQLATIEDNEADYWAERLGREAAVDLLTQGKTSKEVMSRAVLLSEEGYRKFAETCGHIGHTISSISREVEQEQGYASLPEGMPR
jgi:hypothetical protein